MGPSSSASNPPGEIPATVDPTVIAEAAPGVDNETLLLINFYEETRQFERQVGIKYIMH